MPVIYSMPACSNHRVKFIAELDAELKSPDRNSSILFLKASGQWNTDWALELLRLIEFYNNYYAHDDFNKVDFSEVQRLAKTCSTGCEIADPVKVEAVPEYKGFSSRLVRCANKIK